MIRENTTVYICNYCGKVEIANRYYNFGRYVAELPDGWKQIVGTHLCPKCSKIYQKIKEEIDDEDNEE